MFANVTNILQTIGKAGVEALKNDVEKVSATNETANSIHERVESTDTKDVLKILGRKFFSTLETGRGPRKNSTYEGFDDHMLKYMEARGIGADLSEKKRQQLARFLTLKINREGDKTFKAGGRIVYSKTLQRIIDDLKKALKKDFAKFYLTEITNQFKREIKKAA
jgi:hypothetical protein